LERERQHALLRPSHEPKLRSFVMTDIRPVLPRTQAPDLNVATVGGGSWKLADSRPQNFTLVVFYRGLHCPICAKYLIELERLTPEFESRGVRVLALSSDDAGRAKAMAERIKADRLRIGHSLSLTVARQWGLYISTSRGKTSVVSTNQICSANQGSSSCVPMARFTTGQPRPCRSPGHRFRICSARSTS